MRALSLVKAHAYGNDFLLAPGVPIADAGRLAGLAREAGFVEVGRMLREPLDGERFRRGALLMHAG